jgi:pimeloyl-ACP methyl ester carboxylesterase
MDIILRSPVAFSLILQVLLGCGQKHQISDASAPQSSRGASTLKGVENPEVAVLYFGGFGSCSFERDRGYSNNVQPAPSPRDNYGMTMVRWADRFEKTFSKPHRTLIACYPFWTNLLRDGRPAPSDKDHPETQIPFPDHVNAMDANIYLRHNLDGTWIPTEKIKLSQMLATLQNQLTSQGIKKVAIMGHSYGGYTAMLVAKTLLKSDSSIKVTSLTTLDPISMDTCQPSNIVVTLQKNAVPPGCNQAPASTISDNYINSAEIRRIAASIPWINIWQGADKYLHSSPISAPGVDNKEVIYSKDKIDGVANHILFLYPQENTNSTWRAIADDILKKVAKALE